MPCCRTLPAAALSFAIAFQYFPLLAQTLITVSEENHTTASVRPKVRITDAIDEQVRVALAGNRHPLAQTEYEAGPAPSDRRMEHMILALDPDPDQQKALDELIADQQNPRSRHYHQWLTPESFGGQFGVSQYDLEQVVSWLKGHGLVVDEIPSGRRAIVFSGTAEQVESAFHTQLRAYRIDGNTHYANATDPEIPRALGAVVRGAVALHDFESKPALAGMRPVTTPQLTWSDGTHSMAPADLAAIYDLAPLYQSSVDGTGQSVAVVARCNIHLSDVRTFRSYFGLPAKDPTVIVNGTDPGILAKTIELVESTMDVEWAGAVARNANVQLVVSASTSSTDGIYLSAMYIVNHNLAPVMTMSFGVCEAWMGSAGNAWVNGLWQQAAAQGITVLVSSGDQGAAGCDSDGATTATHGLAVNGLCSPPYSTCVGGTEFSDAANAGQYWSARSDPATKGSAQQYIPETTWNDSGIMPGGSQIWAGGGGASRIYGKPAWQTGLGVPSDGWRDVPDVSLSASEHDGYLISMNGQFYCSGGTSASAPAFAGLMALVNQKTGARQGNANPTLYTLANNQQNGGAAAFHDVTTGSNTVPGVTGFPAGPGYDEATGLGSVDAAVLVNHWTDAAHGPVPSLQLSVSLSSITVVQGASGSINATVSISDGFNSVVQLSAASLPSGVTASFVPPTLAAPGSGASSMTLSAGPQATPGVYNVQVTASGAGVTPTTSSISLTITPALGFTLALAKTALSLNLNVAVPATTGVAVSVTGGFRSPVSLTVAGLPTGMNAYLVPASFAAPGSGSSTLTLDGTMMTAGGSFPIQVSAAGGGLVQTATLVATVSSSPFFDFSFGPDTVEVVPGGTGTASVGTTAAFGFNSPITLSVSGLPVGVTAVLSPARFPAPGSGTSTLTLTATPQMRVGTYPAWITASGGGQSPSMQFFVSVTPFTLATNPGSPYPPIISEQQGKSANVQVLVKGGAGFNSPVTLSVAGLPAGVTAVFSPAGVRGPGTHSSTLKLTAASNATTGITWPTITAAGGGITKTGELVLKVTSR